MNRSWTTLIIVLTVMILRTLRSVALSGVEATTSGPGTSRGSWLAAQGSTVSVGCALRECLLLLILIRIGRA